MGHRRGGAGPLSFSLAVPGEQGRGGRGEIPGSWLHNAKDPQSPTLGSLKLCCPPEGLLRMAGAGDPPREWTPVRLFPSPDSALC